MFVVYVIKFSILLEQITSDVNQDFSIMAQHLRKLVSLMFTDIYGYSKLMSHDENKALNILAVHDTVLEKEILEFNGNILKKMGDAFFAEFSSPVHCLKCAIKIQEKFHEYNFDKDPSDRILVRIGLHVGEVVVRDNDLFGNGVNVAARLEPLADPGGICISESLYKSVQKEININAFRIGNVELKNILEKYTIYKIPSPYSDQVNEKSTHHYKNEMKYRYRIKKIVNIPVTYFSPIEFSIFTSIFSILFFILLGYFLVGRFAVDAYWSLLHEKYFIIIPLIILLAITIIYFYSEKKIRIIFNDIRNVDSVLDFVADQIGYNSIIKMHDKIIYKPSVYNFIMYSARKIHVQIDGSSVILHGNYMFIKKLLRMIILFENSK